MQQDFRLLDAQQIAWNGTWNDYCHGIPDSHSTFRSPDPCKDQRCKWALASRSFRSSIDAIQVAKALFVLGWPSGERLLMAPSPWLERARAAQKFHSSTVLLKRWKFADLRVMPRSGGTNR